MIRLSDALRARATDDAVASVLSQGSAFVPTSLSRGRRRRKPGNCYAVAGGLALAGAGFHAEGFALHPGDPAPVKHAWITTDGTDTVDPSCARALECSYLGVPFSQRPFARLLIQRGYHGQFDPVDDTMCEALLTDPFNFKAPVQPK